MSQYPLTKQILLERYTHHLILEQSSLDLPEQTYMKRVNIKTLLMLPLVFQNQTVGLVELIGQGEQVFSNQEISIAQLLTNEAASALVNSKLYEQLNHRLVELSTLNQISQAIASTLNLTEILSLVTKGTLNLMEVEAVSVALLEDDQKHLQFVAAAGKAAVFIKNKRLNLNQGIAGWVIQHGEPLLVQDVHN